MSEKMGVDDWLYHFQETGVDNPSTALLDLIKTNQRPFMATEEATKILDLALGDIKREPGQAKQILLSDQVLLALSIVSEVEYQRFINDVEAVGVRGFKTDLKKAVTETKKENTLPVETSDRTVGDCFSDDSSMPVEVAGLIIPPGWSLNRDGLFHLEKNIITGRMETIQDCFCPILINRRLVDINGGPEKIEFGFWRDGILHKIVDLRITFADPKRFIGLSNMGLPITIHKAGKLVSFLGDFEAINKDRLGVSHTSERFGWHGGSFILGDSIYSSEKAVSVCFHSNDIDTNLTLKALQPRGTYDAYVNNIRFATMGRAKLMIIVAAAYVGFILKIIDMDSFIVDIADRSSTGKTSAGIIAGSSLGYCGKIKPASLLKLFNATPYGIENLCYSLNDCFLFLDDTHSVLDERVLKNLVYLIANGTGKTRGSKTGGNQFVKKWNLVAITTGEAALEDVSTWTGARARVLTVRNPWGGSCGESVQVAVESALQNYGHGAPRFVRWLIDNRNEWPKLRKKFKDIWVSLMPHCEGVEVAERKAKYFAAIVLVATLINDLFGFGWDLDFGESGLPVLFEEPFCELVLKNSNRSTGIAGFDVIRDFIFSNRSSFEEGANVIGRVFGKWEDGIGVGVFGSLLREELKRHSFNPDAVFNELIDKKALEIKSVRMNGGPRRLHCFKWGVLEKGL
ncbi:MAG: DUF927 domain-containing protein [Dehalobacter sp.]|nr:DUF927 domain-containing protein [Dehalobacter sp.]